MKILDATMLASVFISAGIAAGLAIAHFHGAAVDLRAAATASMCCLGTIMIMREEGLLS